MSTQSAPTSALPVETPANGVPINQATNPALDGQPASTPPPSPPAPVTPPAGYVPVTMLEQARTEEKAKLYGEQKKLKEEIQELRTQLQAKMSPDERLQSQITDLQRQLGEANARVEAIQQELQNEQARHRQLQLQSYLDKRLSEEREKGNKMLMHLVRGSTEQEIDTSIQLAIAEYKTIEADVVRERGLTAPPAPPLPVAVVPVAAAGPPPSAFPTAPNAQAPAPIDAGTEGYAAEIAELTSPEAIRDGRYAANRDRLLQLVRQSPTPAGGPFANTPRVLVAPQRNGTVVQPTGHPTGPVANPRVVTAPPAPNPNPVNAAPQVPGAQGVMPPSAHAHAQALTGPPAQGPVYIPAPPQNGGFDAAAARAAAEASAKAALANPAHAGRVQVLRGGPPKANGEYAGRPNTNVDFSGGHPMERTTT